MVNEDKEVQETSHLLGQVKHINKSTTWSWDSSVDRLGLREGESARGNGKETTQPSDVETDKLAVATCDVRR